MTPRNVDEGVVRGFGWQWSHFDQSLLSHDAARELFEAYFSIFPWDRLPANATGFDFGCGSGRWARHVAPRTGRLHCIDAAPEAVAVARRNLAEFPNCEFHIATSEAIPLEGGSADFGYSLGVLHHIPDTFEALRMCVAKLRSGAPFLVYLYYRFDNQPKWFVALWRVSDAVRWVVSRLPYALRYAISQLIAAFVYWPASRLARIAEKLKIPLKAFPLSLYRNRTFYVMRTDAFDRFCTRLEQRFTRAEIASMLERAGLKEIVFSDAPPYWVATGIKS